MASRFGMGQRLNSHENVAELAATARLSNVFPFGFSMTKDCFAIGHLRAARHWQPH